MAEKNWENWDIETKLEYLREAVTILKKKYDKLEKIALHAAARIDKVWDDLKK